MRRRDSSSACTNWATMEALRPPNSGGLPGSSQPWSNCRRCHSRAHCGTWALERDRSTACAWVGRCSSRNAWNSARNASTSGSKVSCTVLLGDPGLVLARAAEHQFAGLGPLERELQVVLPRESHASEQL